MVKELFCFLHVSAGRMDSPPVPKSTFGRAPSDASLVITEGKTVLLMEEV